MKKNKGMGCFKRDLCNYLTEGQLEKALFDSQQELSMLGTTKRRKDVLDRRITRIYELLAEH